MTEISNKTLNWLTDVLYKYRDERLHFCTYGSGTVVSWEIPKTKKAIKALLINEVLANFVDDTDYICLTNFDPLLMGNEI